MSSHCGHLPSLDQAATRPTSANRSNERAAVFIIARESGQHRKAEERCGAERGEGKKKKSRIMLCRGPSRIDLSSSTTGLENSRAKPDGGSWRRNRLGEKAVGLLHTEKASDVAQLEH